MLRRLRILLLCLIALALPVQGIAAASMTCEALLHASDSAVDEAQAHAEAADVADVDHPCHHAHSGSSACASCCTPAAPAPALQVFPSASTEIAVFLTSAHFAVAFITGGIERPPRFVPATV